MASRRVPPEIWFQIIQEASSVPAEAFDTRDYEPLPPSGTFDIHSNEVFAILRQVLSTKSAISLVCRAWNNIVTEFFYSFIIVRDAAHIPLLIEQLSREDMYLSTKVQRLDFVCSTPKRDVRHNGTSYNARQLAYAAVKLIRLCTRLRVLLSDSSLWESVSWRNQRSNQYLVQALTPAAGTLECLEWHSRWIVPARLLLSNLHLPRLRSLQLHFQTNDRSSSSATEAGPQGENVIQSSDEEIDGDGSAVKNGSDPSTWTFPPLQTLGPLYLHPVEWEAAIGHLPSLRHIVVGPTLRPILPFRNLSGVPQVTAVTLCRNAFRNISFTGFDLPPTVRTLVCYLDEFPITPLNLRHIERLGLRGTERSTPEEYDFALNLLVGGGGLGDGHFPSLNLIRFMDATLAGTFQQRLMQFRLWERRCRSKGVRLEDERGRLMTSGHL